MANINKNIIMQAGAAVANAANKAAGISAATPEPGSIISVIQLVNSGRTIGPDSLAHFTESVRNKLLSLLVTMEPIQSGAGDPSPDNVRPISGRTGLNVWRTGKNLIPSHGTGSTSAGVTYTINSDGSVSVSGTATASSWWKAGTTQADCDFIKAGTYKLTGGISASKWVYIIGKYVDGTAINNSTVQGGVYDRGSGLTFTLPQDAYITYQIQIVSGTECDDTFYPMIRLATDEDDTFEPYNGNTYTFDWTSEAGTVYAGSADIVSGDIKAAPYYPSYNGETLVGPWVSSMDVYDPEGTPTTGAQVVDLGGAMTEYHITGQDIITLVGDNYIWSDSGDVTITE